MGKGDKHKRSSSPLHRKSLVKDPIVAIAILVDEEAEHAQPIICRHDDDIPTASQKTSIVQKCTSRALQKGTSFDEEEDGQLGARISTNGGKDVEIETVLGLVVGIAKSSRQNASFETK